MRIVVDLPAPLGPRNPMISPSSRLEAHLVDGDEIAEALGEPVGDDPDFALQRLAHSSVPFGEQRDEQVLHRRRYALDLVDRDASRGERAIDFRPRGAPRRRPPHARCRP